MIVDRNELRSRKPEHEAEEGLGPYERYTYDDDDMQLERPPLERRQQLVVVDYAWK